MNHRRPRTLLIYPPFHRLHSLKNRFFPIGLGYLAGALKAAGFEAAIYNAENYDDRETMHDGRSHSDTYAYFQKYQDALDNPDHYVWDEVRRTIARLQAGRRRHHDEILHASVGADDQPHRQGSRARSHRGLGRSACVDSAGRNDRASTMSTLSRGMKASRRLSSSCEPLESGAPDWSAIDGLVWRDDAGNVVHNKIRTNMPDIDQPFHARQVRGSDAGPVPARTTMASCSRAAAARGRARSVIHVGCGPERSATGRRSISSRKCASCTIRYGVRDFYFWDDTFTPNKKHSHKMFDAMIAEFQAKGQPITWQATTRCDCVDDELAKKMKASGCRLLTYGIESGSPSMMKILKKGITHEKVEHAQTVMRKADIPWDAFFMIGFPDDTPETIEETMAMIRRIECRSAAISIFTPYPGLEMYDLAKSYGLIKEPIEWRYFSHQSPINHFVKNIGREEFSAIAANASTKSTA